MFLRGSIQLGAVFSFIRVSVYKITPGKCEICVMLKSFPDMSVMMEHIHVVKTSVIAGLTVTILKYLRSVSW